MEPANRLQDLFAAAQVPFKPFVPEGVPIIQDGYVGILNRDGTSVFIGVRRDLHGDECPKLARAALALREILVIFPTGTRVGVEWTVDLNFAAEHAVCLIHRTNGVAYIDWEYPGTEGAYHIPRDKALEAITAP
jgi:hypothetical protein